MNQHWTLFTPADGLERPCAALGVSGARLNLASQAVGTCVFALDGAAYDADTPFAEHDTVLLRYRGATVFYGRVIALDRAGGAGEERVTVTLGDPWYYLENITYEQPRHYRASPDDEEDETLLEGWSSRVVLNQQLSGAPMDSAAQLIAALQFAIDRYRVPLQIGAVPANVVAPFAELNSRTIAEIVGLMLRLLPDAASWFDHATDPPTLHFTRRAGAEARTLDLGAGVEITDGQIRARHDLLRTGVKIIYDYGNATGSLVPCVDVAGTGGEYNLQNLVVTVPLTPGTPPVPQQYHVDYAPVAPDSAAWWQGKNQIPKDATDIKIEEVKRTPEIHREVIGGAFPPGYASALKNATVTCKASYKIRNADGAGKDLEGVPLSVSLNGTTVVQEDWTLYAGGTGGEEPPAGLAAQLLEGLGELQYEATLTLAGDEADPRRFHPGQALNLAGGRPEWAAARMQLQAVALDLDQGLTTLSVGPAATLSAADYVEILRALRERRAGAYAAGRVTGGATAGGKARDGGVTANTSGGGSEAFASKQVMTGSGNGDKKTITTDAGQGLISLTTQDGMRKIVIDLNDLDPADAQNGGGLVLKFRTVEICEHGRPKYVYVLMSEAIDSGN